MIWSRWNTREQTKPKYMVGKITKDKMNENHLHSLIADPTLLWSSNPKSRFNSFTSAIRTSLMSTTKSFISRLLSNIIKRSL